MPSQDETLLLHLNEAIATARDHGTLFKTITTKLRLIFPFDLIGINVFDAEHKNRRLFLRDYFDEELGAAAQLAPKPTGYEPVRGTPVEQLLLDPRLQRIELAEMLRRYPDFLPFQRLQGMGLRYMTTVPLRLAGQLIGSLMLVARREPRLSAEDEALLEKISSLIAVAVTNALAFEEVARREQERSLQLNITNALLSIKQREPLFRAIAEELSRVLQFNYFGIRVQRPDQGQDFEGFAEFSRHPADSGPFVALDPDRHKDSPYNHAQLYGQMAELLQSAGLFTGPDFHALAVRYPLMRYVYEQHHTRALLVVPIWQRPDSTAVLILAHSSPTAFSADDLGTVRALVPQVALALENLFAFEQIEELKSQVERERSYLMDEINTTTAFNFGEFVGQSEALRQLQVRIGQVAPTDTTVLITGETGTGKELAARALHQLSPRRERALIKLNCAALPAQLIESELFGHEKGAFTGATERRTGKFELADGGTIFLDEVGELPLDLQAKLLRVLQEKEFERIGGSQVLRSDARVLAATNRVLEEEVAAGRFRADLYYRLNVFPLPLTPLRERREDIEPLTYHFLERLAKRLAKPARQLRSRDLAALQAYDWPGNIRELEHVLEQAVIVSQGSYLEFAGFAATAAQAGPALPEAPAGRLKTLREQERDHILAALQRTGGRVSGPQGAAVLLDINPKTLEARMKKLGIRRLVGVEPR